MRTPTDCSANTSPRVRAWLGLLRTSLTESPMSSMAARAKLSAGIHRPRSWPSSWNNRRRRVVQPQHETADCFPSSPVRLRRSGCSHSRGLGFTESSPRGVWRLHALWLDGPAKPGLPTALVNTRPRIDWTHMAPKKRRILVTGVARWWGALLVQRLVEDPDVAEEMGIDNREERYELGRADYLKLDIRHSL